ncbi:MAG: sulfatase-like hydrolase/transferase [Verrucomicrobiota bacterium JB025]|nr:sulfatase-like hydrolase/transferase [Verrucomicrobiota bacterium JB025]
MKPHVSVAAAAFLMAVAGARAEISAGDVIGIDFGADEGTAAGWNTLSSINSGIAAGSLVNTSNVVVSGVSFTSSGAAGENDAAEVSSSYPGIPANAQGDWWFENAAGGFTLEFAGLDDSLGYDLVIGAYNAEATSSPALENSRTEWTVGGGTQTTVAADLDGSYVTFTGLQSSGGVLTIASNDDSGNLVGAVAALQLTAVDGTPADEDSIRIDFGATAPASANWNAFAMVGSTTTVSNLVRSSDGVATEVGLTVTGISGNGSNHLVGGGSTDATIYVDHIFAQNESPDDTLTFTISGLDDSLVYGLSGGFRRDSNRFEHVWTVGTDERTNAYDGAVVDGYETFSGLVPSGGQLSFSISDLDTGDDWASIAELTLTAASFASAPPVAHGQNVRTQPDTARGITLSGSGDDLTFSVVTQPEHGTLSGTAPELTYTPTGGFTGHDGFTFTVSDGGRTSDPAAVSITVAEKGPNFIIFLTDDQGYNDLGVQGSPHIRTPRIDSFASQGIRFTSGYVPSPVCGPCRAGLLTGSYPIRIAEPGNEKNHHTEPHADEIYLPELLGTAGYTSALIGKWHNSGGATNATDFAAGRGPIDQGFDSFYGTPLHNGVRAVDTGTNVNTSILRADAGGTTVVDADLDQSEADEMIYNYTEEAKAFITGADAADQPFFLMLAHNMPHVSLGARQSFRDSAAARGLDVYTAVIEELDWSFGEIVDTLDELGITDETLVIYSSDNGPWTQENLEGYYGSAFPLRGSKMRSLEGGPRVPYIVRWPGTVTPGVVSDELVTLMDLFPTFLDYAEVEMPEDLEIDGKSIRSLIEGTTSTSPHDYYYYYCYTQLSAVRDSRWKLVLPRRNNPASSWMAFWRGWQDRVDEVELYDLDNDREETTNVAARYPAVVKRLLDQAEVARAELGDKDRIGSGARFFDDPATRRPDIDLYNNSASQPYVNEPLTGMPGSVRTAPDRAVVSYDDAEAYTSVELVWAYEDQGQQAAGVWEAADGGGSASLGAKSGNAPVEAEITGLNPFRDIVYRFILTNVAGTFWSIPATIPAQEEDLIAYEIGIDFSDGGNTEGSGSEPGWSIINGDGTTPVVHDIRTGNEIPGVAIVTTGISGGEMTATNLGFGVASYGNYLDTPFSDLSANDAVEAGPGTMQVVLSGLDDRVCYDVQVVAMPETDTGLSDLTIDVGGLSQVATYESFRPYINNDPAPYTNSDLVLTSPFYSRPVLVPVVFENLSADGAGTLTITLSDDEAMPVNAIHVTARATRHLVGIENGTQFNFWASPLPAGQSYQIRSSTDLEVWTPMVPPREIGASTSQPLSVPIDPNESRRFFRVFEGAD